MGDVGGPFNTSDPGLGDPIMYGDMQLDPPDKTEAETTVKHNVAPQGGNSGGSGSVIFPVVMQNGTTRVEFGPAVRIGPRDVVTVSANINNINVTFISTSGPESARVGPRLSLAVPAAGNVPSRVMKVRNLNEIGIYNPAPGEGVDIEVQFAGGL